MHLKSLKHPHNAPDIRNALGYWKVLELLKALAAGGDENFAMLGGFNGQPTEGDLGGNLSLTVRKLPILPDCILEKY